MCKIFYFVFGEKVNTKKRNGKIQRREMVNKEKRNVVSTEKRQVWKCIKLENIIFFRENRPWTLLLCSEMQRKVSHILRRNPLTEP